jgi:hypothetical protein
LQSDSEASNGKATAKRIQDDCKLNCGAKQEQSNRKRIAKQNQGKAIAKQKQSDWKVKKKRLQSNCKAKADQRDSTTRLQKRFKCTTKQ